MGGRREDWAFLFFVDSRGNPGHSQLMMVLFKAIRGAAVDFFNLGCGSLAASLSFFALLSLFPMVFLLLNVIGFFGSHDQIGHEYVITFIQGFLPTIGQGLAEEIERVASEQVVQGVVLLTFAWFGTLVFYEVEYAVQVVFRSHKTRNPLISTIRSVALLGLVEILLISSFLVTQIMNLLVSFAPQVPGLDVVAVGAASQFLLSYLLPFVLLLTSVTCLYRYLPHFPPGWREALIGGLFLVVFWELAKHLFSSYVQNLSVYGRMYGSLLAVVLFLLWVYYSAALFLFGAALVHRLQSLLRARSSIPTPSSPLPEKRKISTPSDPLPSGTASGTEPSPFRLAR